MGTTNSVIPLTLLTDIYPLTQEQMLDFRKTHIRDLVTSLGLDSVTVLTGGSGYLAGDILTVGSPGVAAACYVDNVDGSGAILSVKVTNPGSAYVTVPDITGGTGTAATFLAVIATTKLSAYNRATGAQFFADSDISALLLAILIDKQEELLAVYNDKWNLRIQAGDDSAIAVSSGSQEQLVAIYRLLRADCFQRYLDDPAFQGSVAEMGREQFFKQLGEAVTRDRNWTRQRSAGFRSVEILRK